jgi:hypothetical protein
MNSRKNLVAQVAGAMAIAALVGTSAFAETRHSDATESDHNRQSSSDRSSRQERRDRSGSQNQTRERRDTNTTAPQTYQRSETRNNGTWNRNETRNNGTFDRSQTRSNETWNRGDSRNNNRSYDRSQADSYRNNTNNRSYDRSQSYRNNRPQYDSRGRRSEFLEGRINRYEHERGGYRVWIDGGRFPVWIPEARISLFPRLRVGLSIRFGGYYDPLGYLDAYDYYNDGYYGGGYGSGAYSSGLLRGVVETVDYRRGTLVLRDDVSGSFVTALIRDRRLETLRPGDYAEIAGDWTRAGVFEGLRLEDSRDGRY